MRLKSRRVGWQGKELLRWLIHKSSVMKEATLEGKER